MDLLVSFAEGFMNLFQVGADNFVSWVTGIVPTVLILLIAMNTLIALIGQNRINRFAKFSAKNPLLRYMVVPFLGAFMLGNPINPGEVFIFLGIANGITTLGQSYMPLAVRYLLAGLVCNFISGWATDFTTKMVMKQQGIELSNELKEA